MSLSIGKPFAIPPAAFVPSARATLEYVQALNAGTLFVVPSILQDIAALPDNVGIEALRPLEYIAFGGGPLSPSVGDKLVQEGINIINGFGTTEAGSMGVLQPPRADRDWRYFRLRDDLRCKAVEVTPGRASGASIQYVFSIQPAGWEDDFEMSDRLEESTKRPGKDFRILGRTDDAIILKTGENIGPHILETLLTDRSDVRAALAFGHGQFQIGVLIEPINPVLPDDVNRYKDSIWPTIIQAGKQMDSPAGISSRELVIVLQPSQELPRSGKGSVLRKSSWEMFSNAIEEAYQRLDNPFGITPSETHIMNEEVNKQDSQNGADASYDVTKRTNGHTSWPRDVPYKPVQSHHPTPAPKTCTTTDAYSKGAHDSIEEDLLAYIQTNIWKPHACQLSMTDDLFQLGMDSLQATQIRRFLLGKVPRSENDADVDIPVDLLYTHTSIAKIAAYLRGGTKQATKGADAHAVLNDLLNQYATSVLPAQDVAPKATVLLTGGTGALGCHLLARLASSIFVERIIVLNRPGPDGSNPYTRKFRSSRIKGALIPLSVIDKVDVIETDLARPLLGLSGPMYWSIAAHVTHIIHNAFPVTFKRSVASFESQFKVMSHLLQLARDSGGSPKFVFVSSIAAVAQFTGNPGLDGLVSVPEGSFRPGWTPPAMGYGQAKLICEKMLEQAVRENIVHGAIARSAQISGAISNGYWNPPEYFPTLLRNSQRVGALPEMSGTLSWLPLETAAAAMTDLLFLPPTEMRLVFHVENPSRQTWKSTMTATSEALALPILSYDEWLDRVRGLAEDEEHGATLYSFFEKDFRHVGSGKVYLNTTETKRVSPTLRECGMIPVTVLRRYISRTLLSR